jgi:DNA processing protein
MYKNSYSDILVHLCLIKDIGSSIIEKIIASSASNFNLDQLYTFNAHDFMMRYGLSQETAEKIVSGLADKKILEVELELILKHKIQLITCFDPAYPALLKCINLPPPILYYKGSLPEHANTIAIVGSREANSYAQEIIAQMVLLFVAHNFIIVSGGARGADAMAHQATVDAQGKTIAVLGSGLLNLYPKQNIKLFNAIIEKGGAVISSFPLTAESLPYNFPIRNRIISGLSKGCIVVQAAEKSGTRITANFALDQGREVFAVPGSIHDPLSAGCHALIQQGAKLVTNAQDVLVEFGYSFEKNEKKSNPEKQISLVFDNPLEAALVSACFKPTSQEDLLEVTQLSFSELNSLLFDLQLKKIITQTAAGLWQKC